MLRFSNSQTCSTPEDQLLFKNAMKDMFETVRVVCVFSVYLAGDMFGMLCVVHVYM